MNSSSSEMKPRSPVRSQGPYVDHRSDDGHRSIRQRFDRLAAAAGLSRITFHDLRHSYATGALKAGISPKVVSQRIGHANVGFFLQT
jgi:integrase